MNLLLLGFCYLSSSLDLHKERPTTATHVATMIGLVNISIFTVPEPFRCHELYLQRQLSWLKDFQRHL